VSRNNIVLFSDKDLTESTDLTIYPTFTYPVIWKPFSVNGTMCIFDGSLSSENKTIDVLNVGEIVNGITYKKLLDDDLLEKTFSNVSLSFYNYSVATKHDEINEDDLSASDRHVTLWTCSQEVLDGTVYNGNFGNIVTEGAPDDYDTNEELNYFTQIKLENRNNYINIDFPDSIYAFNENGEQITAFTGGTNYYLKPVDDGGNEHDLITDGNNNVKYYGVLNTDQSLDEYFDNNIFKQSKFNACKADTTSFTTNSVITDFNDTIYEVNDITSEIIDGTPIECIGGAYYKRIICKVTNGIPNSESESNSSKTSTVIRVYTTNY
jgi:hypothetical protein